MPKTFAAMPPDGGVSQACFIALFERRVWSAVIPFLDFTLEVRRPLYTTNPKETLNSAIRRAVRIRGHVPSDEPAAKLI